MVFASTFVLMMAQGPTSQAHSVEPAQVATRVADDPCHSQDPQDIVVCAQRRQAYRLDPNVTNASRASEILSRNATAAVPPAEAICASSPPGCGKGLESLDLANVALVVGTVALKAAKGEDWRKAFRVSPDEYQLYVAAKNEREAREVERKAQALAAAARSKADRGAPDR